nr:hypothetical protein [Tanacetum cinerariifolium]
MPSIIKNTCVLIDLLVRPQGLSNPWRIFNRPNIIDWYEQLRIVLSVKDKLIYVENLIPTAPILAQAEIQRNLENLGAYKMLQELKTLFPQQTEQELLQTMQEFHSCKQEEKAVCWLLRSKNKELYRQSKASRAPVSLGLGHKKSQPQLAARGQNQRKGKNKLAYAPKTKITPPPKKEDPAKDSICNQCGKTCHWKRNCPQYLAELLKNKRLSQGACGSGIFTIELYTFPNKSWVYDTGYNTHICNITQGLRGSRKLNLGALCLYMGNGQRAAVEAIGSYHLSLPSELDIILNNYHYAPSITRGIISVSCYSLKIVARILNMVLTKKVEKTPYEVWHGQAPKLSYLKFWCCEALVKRDYLTKSGKLEPYSIKCIFIGYPKETIGYSFYYQPENKVLVARNAEFIENSLITQKASGSSEDLKNFPEEDTHPSIEIYEPQSDIIPIRRSTRTQHALDRMCIYTDGKEHVLGVLGEPTNYKAALLNHESDN